MDQVIANRYQLGRQLGAGGMARVVAAHDLRLDRSVAVKLVPVAGIDRAGRERFVREARSSAGFTHPNAVSVYDAGEGDGFLYLVMELIDGPSLATRLTERGRLSTEEALRIAEPVLAALGAAHAAGIVHRDVKPGNILLSSSGAVKLADFGIAKRLDDMASDLTGSGQFVGTPKYLAPEQVAGARPTPATDLYAVGVVLYEMLAGHPPFDAGDQIATAIAHRDAPIPDLHRTRPDVPDHVVAAVRRAMAKDPAQRFASAARMAAALAAPGAPTVAMPAPVVAVAAPAAAGTGPEPTEIMLAPRGSRRRLKPWWWAAAAGLLVGGGVALAIAQRDDDPDASAGPTSTGSETATTPAPAATRAPATTLAPSTVPDTTAPPPTTPPPTPPPTLPPPPESLEELIAFVAADLDRFGQKAPEFLNDLQKVEEENGPKQAERADELLQRMDEWVASGELSPELEPLVEQVLVPIADGPGNGNGDENRGPGDGDGDD
jgi:eukaryotic-like serine/threonine-protein kinase